MTLYKRWPKEISIFFREIVMRTRHPGGNGNFLPGKNLAWEEITISSRVTSAHDDFTEKKGQKIRENIAGHYFAYIDSNRNRFSEWAVGFRYGNFFIPPVVKNLKMSPR